MTDTANDNVKEIRPGVTNEDKERAVAAMRGAAIAVARIAYEVNRAWRTHVGETDHPSWDKAPDWMKASTVEGVLAVMANPKITPAQSHALWMGRKMAEGWVLGPRNDTAKTHPCLLPYNDLTTEQKFKDTLFAAVVRSALGLPQD